MKNKILLFVLVIFGFAGQAQRYGKSYNQFSIEAAYGISIPLNYVSSNNSAGNYISTTHFDVGLRYMFTKELGVKGEMSFDNYDGDDDYGMKTTRLDAQVYYNLGQSMGLVYATNETVGMLAHTGFGVSFNKSSFFGSAEHTGNFIIGLTPIFKITDKIALSTDFSYGLNFKQHVYYDGVPFNKPPEMYSSPLVYKNAGQFNITIGAIFYLGSERNHADWY